MAATKGLGTTGNAVGTVTPLDHKLAQSGLISKRGGGSNLVRPGLFYDGVSTIVSGKANMSYDIAPFTAALTRSAGAGTVLLANDGVVNVVTTAAPGSNSRIDSVYVWQREFSLDGTDSNPVIGVVQGTPAASPVAPSLAAFPGAIELARIVVPAGVVATNSGTTITQTAPFTATAGGVLAFRTTVERDALSVPAGTICIVLADARRYVYTGSVWFEVGSPGDAGQAFREAAGIETFGASLANGGFSSVTVNFPASRFSVEPLVVATTNSARLAVQIDTKSASSMRLSVGNFSGASATPGVGDTLLQVEWHAIQMLSGAAAG